MADKHDLKAWVLEAVEAQDGRASVLNVAKHIWQVHEPELRASGDLFFTWQYDMRWAAQALRDDGQLELVGRDWVIPR
jgi:hypothetical protein